MDKLYELEKIPVDMYDELNYTDNKEMFFETFDKYLNGPFDCTPIQAVNSAYYHDFDELMYENGMDKFIAMISGMLYMIKHNNVDDAIAYVMNFDIETFKMGKYNEFFTQNDLKLVNDDIKIIKDYLAQYPELLGN